MWKTQPFALSPGRDGGGTITWVQELPRAVLVLRSRRLILSDFGHQTSTGHLEACLGHSRVVNDGLGR
jgi:hypothetical protein